MLFSNPSFHKCILVLCAVMMASSCTSGPGRQTKTLESLTDGEGKLKIIAWDGYIESGENDPAVDWVTDFEKKTGCDIEVETAYSSDEISVLMAQEGYDLVTAPSDVSTRLIDDGKVQPINISLIPTWDELDPRFINSQWHTVDGIHYGVPFMWNVNRLLYSEDVFRTPPNSLGVTFEEQTLPDGISNSNRVQAYEGAMAIADAAVYLMQTRPGLGIINPYELNREQFGDAVELLREQRRLVNNYWADANEQILTFPIDGSAVSLTWPYQVKEFERNGVQVGNLIPDGGITGRADTYMLHANAPHPNCAYLWMDNMLNPEIQAEIAAWSGANPSVSGACQADDRLGEEGCSEDGYFTFDDVYFWRTPLSECGDGSRDCVPYSEWVSAYISIIGGN